jgi:hypothetical protein
MSNTGSMITASGGSGMLDPVSNPQAFDFVTVAGQQSPGLLKSIEGFSRDAEWQSKKGKGSEGAASTLIQLPPSKGSLIFELWTSQHFLQWATFSKLFILTVRPGASADSQALAINHPFLVDVGVTAVLPVKLHLKRHLGKGRYVVRVDLLEWVPTPKESVVFTATFSNQSPKSSMPAVGAQPQTTLQKLKAAKASLLQQMGQP